VENAVDFSAAGGSAPVRVSLRPEAASPCSRSRTAAAPAEAVRGKLSNRCLGAGRRDGAGPTWPGLYVARLIAEFHGGAIDAATSPPGTGVAVSATFRLA